MGKFLIIVLYFLTKVSAAVAGDTNQLFLPFDVSTSYVGESSQRHDELIKLAKTLPECRPSDLDPEGHWGEIGAGFQMSVRMATNTFVAGNQISVEVVLRNTTTNSLILNYPQFYAIRLHVLDADGKPLPEPPPPARVSGTSRIMLPAHMQISYLLKLNEFPGLREPGVYYVTAERNIINKRGKEGVELASGKCQFTIVGTNAP